MGEAVPKVREDVGMLETLPHRRLSDKVSLHFIHRRRVMVNASYDLDGNVNLLQVRG